VQPILDGAFIALSTSPQPQLRTLALNSKPYFLFFSVIHLPVLNHRPFQAISMLRSQPSLNPIIINHVKRSRFCKNCSAMGCPGGQSRGTCPN
jgi:hypothetical protein